MHVTRRAVTSGVLAAAAAPALAQAKPWTLPSAAEILAILKQRLDVERQGVGIVVGVIDAHGRRVVSHGALAKGDPRPLNGDTEFEIGSMTKVFTSLVLADMVRRGQVKLDDPVQKYLPAGVHVPERGGKQITLIDLATHTSGLPRMPTNFTPKDPSNPYADYDETKLFAFLNGYTLTRDIGAKYEYSNLAVGLLGTALAHRAGTDYPALVRERITGPLKMRDTTVRLSPDQQKRLAQGHSALMEPVPNWDLTALAGAGALRSTCNDLLVFLAAELGFGLSPLKAAMADQLVPRRPTTLPNTEVALAWHITHYANADVVWHNGGTGGYRTFFGFDPKARIGAVVLTNAATRAGGDDIGYHLLAGRPIARLDPPPPPRIAIPLPADQLAAYVGAYALPLGRKLLVTQDGARLFAQVSGQSVVEIFAEAPDRFFMKVTDVQIDFQRDGAGKVSALVLHQNGLNITAPRVAP
jgi:CubicO group peptidase (beta-lactamase class C family)